MRQYLHDIGARVYFTGERWGEKCRKGAWEWKTTETIQQFLNDNFEAKLGIDFISYNFNDPKCTFKYMLVHTC